MRTSGNTARILTVIESPYQSIGVGEQAREQSGEHARP